MTCREAIQFLTDYLDGRLPWRQRAAFLLHLGLCSDCRNYLASFRKTVQLLRIASQEIDADQFPPVPLALSRAIEGARK